MTTPRYAVSGCSAGSQVGGLASPCAWAPGSDAWNVNFNNGNVNNNDHDNNACVRAVRSALPGECQGAVRFRDLFEAWRRARRQKVPSENQLAFDAHWMDGLIELEHALQGGAWTPRPPTCFIAQRPKARQIHAPDFSDRVVHHWLVPQLEVLFEPVFIADSFANRKGKGTHASVDRLRGFIRQVASGQGGGWYLQLDVANFFNSIHRPTLWRILKRQMQRAHSPDPVQRATHALLRSGVPVDRVIHRSTAAERARVPLHKRLENAPPGRGLPIGNLSSQFFANVYLDRLDQFVKHVLRARRYVRYVDDFVLVHRSRDELVDALARIRAFLADELRLELKADIRLRPLSAGIDFLGYVIYPTHTRVRRRVVRQAMAALRAARAPRSRAERERRRSIRASYRGHFQHANAWRLRKRLRAEGLL